MAVLRWSISQPTYHVCKETPEVEAGTMKLEEDRSEKRRTRLPE